MTTLHSEADPINDSTEYDEAAASQMLSDSAPDTLNASIFGMRYPENAAKSECVVSGRLSIDDRQQEVIKVPGDAAAKRVQNLIQSLFDGIAQRVDGELGLAQRLKNELAEEQVRFQAEAEARQAIYETERKVLQAEYDSVCAEAGLHFQGHYSAASEEYDEALRAANDDY